MEEIAHSAVVTEISSDSVTVEFERKESCGACCLHNVCSQAALQRLSVKVKNAQTYRIGQKVKVVIAAAAGWKAAFLAYGLPLILVLLSLAVALLLTGDETFAAIAALAILPVYYLILHLLSRKFGKKLQIRIR